MLGKILEGCEELFRKYGIKSLSMDDIARELGMSKKTIYQYVTDKNDLVTKTFSHILLTKKERCTCIRLETTNPVEEIKLITREMSQQMKGTNPSIFFDLRKYHPDAWQLFKNYSNEFIYEQIKSNMDAGITQGLYRDDINTDVIARLYISLIQAVTDPTLFSDMDYDFSILYSEMINYHIHAICTSKGLTFFKK